MVNEEWSFNLWSSLNVRYAWSYQSHVHTDLKDQDEQRSSDVSDLIEAAILTARGSKVQNFCPQIVNSRLTRMEVHDRSYIKGFHELQASER